MRFAGLRMIVDPWLLGPEVDGFSWLNKQWHVDPVLSPDEIPNADAILITQSYNDHCHFPTLEKLDPTLPILATQKAFDRLRRKFPKREVRFISHSGAGLQYEGVRILSFHPGKKRDPVYFAVALVNFKNEVVFYAPHGFSLTTEHIERLKPYSIELLITTLTYFKLPKIMGGAVNPGVDEALTLAKKIKAKRLLNTHDEQKKMSGLVALLAETKYTQPSAISSDGCDILGAAVGSELKIEF
jgi:L-ascorbate metabolism protein UlaG (beta-lactamase superfamily)